MKSLNVVVPLDGRNLNYGCVSLLKNPLVNFPAREERLIGEAVGLVILVGLSPIILYCNSIAHYCNTLILQHSKIFQ